MAVDDFKLLLNLNHFHLEAIAEKVIVELIALNDKDFLLAGDDSRLENVWEEICVQRQVEESVHWDAYENTIENFVTDELDNQPESIKTLISYIGGLGNTDYSDEEDQIFIEDGVCAIKERILEKAESYSNDNIYAYINNVDEQDEECEDEGEE